MPAEPELTPAAPGFYGKHPEFGDFLSANLPASADRVLLPWLAQGLTQMREQAGEAWQAVFDAAPPLRFWIGGEVTGAGAALRGVLVPSRDKVGRRHPLLIVVETSTAPDPATDPAQDFHDAAEARLTAALSGPLGPAREFAAALAEDTALAVAEAPGTSAPGSWWAANPAQSPEALWSELASMERRAAAAARSFWWVAAAPGEAGHDGLALACPGMPDPAALAWLLTAAVRRETPAAEWRPEEPDPAALPEMPPEPVAADGLAPAAGDKATAVPEPATPDAATVEPATVEVAPSDPLTDVPRNAPAQPASGSGGGGGGEGAANDDAEDGQRAPLPEAGDAPALAEAGTDPLADPRPQAAPAFGLSLSEFGRALGGHDPRPRAMPEAETEAGADAATGPSPDDLDPGGWLLPEPAADPDPDDDARTEKVTT